MGTCHRCINVTYVCICVCVHILYSNLTCNAQQITVTKILIYLQTFTHGVRERLGVFRRHLHFNDTLKLLKILYQD